VAEVKDSTKKVRLLRFEFSTDQAYVIEAGHQYFRFYMNGGRIESPPGTPVEIVTPYTETDLPRLKYVQSADTLYLAHPNYPLHKLVRQSHTSWTLTPVNLLPPPTYEGGLSAANITLTLGATTGLGVSVTASANLFDASDVGRMLRSGQGRGTIRSVATATSATIDVLDAFSSTTLAGGSWVLEGSPNATLTPSGISTTGGPRHAIATLTLSSPASGWRQSDVGRYVRVNKGVLRITKYSSASVVEAEVLTELANLNAAPGGSWSIEDPAFSDARGYPRAVAFFEQRLILGGSKAQPQTFWGSNSGEYEVFGLGSDDDDAFEFAIAANDVNTINWIVPARVLLMGTASSEFSVSGGDRGTQVAIGPNNVDVKSSTFWGSTDLVAPIRIGNAALFVTRTGTELREMVFSLERDAYIANDLLLLAKHLTIPAGIVDMAYQRHPNSTVWCVRGDGVMLALTYQREHDVVGWSRHLTGTEGPDQTPTTGFFESVVTIPHWNGNRDVTWVVVRRRINGIWKRYIEYLDSVGGYYGHLGVDCGLTYSGSPTTTVTGLGHLEGEVVDILGDGAVYPRATVTGGQVTLQGLPASMIEVGLPFRSVMETMRPEVPTQGTSQGLPKSWGKVWVRVDKTLGAWINGQEIPFRDPNMPMDQAPALFTGDIQVDLVTTDRGATITVEQRQPLPQTVVAIFGELGIGAGEQT
jgi:hypothetical protein